MILHFPTMSLINSIIVTINLLKLVAQAWYYKDANLLPAEVTSKFMKILCFKVLLKVKLNVFIEYFS